MPLPTNTITRAYYNWKTQRGVPREYMIIEYIGLVLRQHNIPYHRINNKYYTVHEYMGLDVKTKTIRKIRLLEDYYLTETDFEMENFGVTKDHVDETGLFVPPIWSWLYDWPDSVTTKLENYTKREYDNGATRHESPCLLRYKEKHERMKKTAKRLMKIDLYKECGFLWLRHNETPSLSTNSLLRRYIKKHPAIYNAFTHDLNN